MYHPLLELPSRTTPAILAGDRLLGEAAGRLYGCSSRAAFEAQGGALYPIWQAANKNVIDCSRWRPSSSDDTWVRKVQPLRVLRKLLLSVTSVLPLLRLAFPFAVPASVGGAPSLLKIPECPERVNAIVFHHNRMILAAAVDEGSGCSRVVVYDVAEGKETCVLTHVFQRHVRCLAWKPFSREVLAVGCEGGVLLWSLSFGVAPAANIYSSNKGGDTDDEGQAAYSLFYRCTPHVHTTCVNFSCRDGRYLACGSTEHVAVHFHDMRLPPSKSLLLRNVTLEGATEDVLFADDDTFAIRLVCGSNTLVMLSFPCCTATAVPTPAPVLKMEKAQSLGPNHFFLQCASVEGVFVAHVNPFVGVQVIALVSTGIDKGIGGGVRRMACSGKRLYLALETGHLLVCHYGCRGVFTLIAVGLAELDAFHMAVFDGCTHGSLLASVEADQRVTFVPSYHS